MGAPSGTITFLFTDIEGSTRLWETAPDAMRTALARHDAIVRGTIEANSGYVFTTGGDGFGSAFASPVDAVAAAGAAQSALDAEPWPKGAMLRVRMGVHTGVAEERDGDYFGPAVNTAARLMAVGHGGQVLCTSVTAELLEGVGVVDLGEHRLRDLSATRRVFQVGGERFPALRSLDTAVGNLPLQISSFVGRDRELGEVAAALGAARLVTVVGAGGVGKTRLAVRAAAGLLSTFADGVWLCELAAAGDADSFAQVVASTLGVAQRSGRSLAESVVEFLRPRRLLLVLDNCEHLLDDSSWLAAAILADCPEVRVLATSREALAISGEQVLPLQHLTLPDPYSGLDEAAASSSVRLFCERGASARPGFALSEANVTAVVEVCRRLDGIPLAIELAAARVVAMTPREIAGLLDERFRLLGGGRRTAGKRHQTLRSAVDWSYGLLSATERVVFDRLAVFSGGFTLAAATAVASGDGVEVWDVVDAVGALAAKSMVVAEPGAEEHTRYQLLETLRQYAQDRLEEDGHAKLWRRRHAQHFAAVAAEVARGLRGRFELAWRERLMGDFDNLRSAVMWGLDSGVMEDQQSAVAIVAWLGYEAWTRARVIGGWAEKAVAALEHSTPGQRSAVLGAASEAAIIRGDLDRAEFYARSALEEGYPLDDPSPCLPSIHLAWLLKYAGRIDDAARLLDAAEVAVVGRADEDYVRSWLQSCRVCFGLFADEDEQITQARLAMSLAQATGNPSNLALASFALGLALRYRHPDEAVAAFDRNVALARHGAGGNPLAVVLCLGARVAASQGDTEGAKTRLRDALEESTRDADWSDLTASLDATVDTFSYLGEARATAVLAGALETALAPRRVPTVAGRGSGPTMRAANLARARETLGDTLYEEARAEGLAMSEHDALAFAYQHL
jgi:predicted ATPase